MQKKQSKEISKEGFLLAYGELFLKSRGVRELMQKHLHNNLEFQLKKTGRRFKVHILRDRIFVECKDEGSTATALGAVFGLSWFAKSYFFPGIRQKGIKNIISKLAKKEIGVKETFALEVRCTVADEKREKIIDEIAPLIERKVNLGDPDHTVHIEVRDSGWFVYFKKEKGAGGLPAGSEGRALTLMSGGIDSPVAAWMVARRGAENIWLHFHSFPLVSAKSMEKVRELGISFTRFQPRLKVYFIPFSDIQLKIKLQADPKYRVLLYRRAMFKIAEMIARKERCEVLVTGEALGQVASQTMRNLSIVEDGIKLPILRPLIGMDKEEIISLSKKIGTYEISVKPQEDCCTLFIPPHPTAEGKLEEIKKLEKNLKLNRLIMDAIKYVVIEIF